MKTTREIAYYVGVALSGVAVGYAIYWSACYICGGC